ncbi:DUF541 domain-containing protein [Hymenobacter gummosus]|uniref:DUF541 domain-containing protein n=1 Tax=Hymenobacter gummosus TaxID=1776032 RepID=A0A3S0H3G0_9BACT|nr:SIMPL domain-containing protein [Hymenobacter gummosus]RTQ47856.1 DUF541 domain-containing protein [Hymenobacter gummosus]
MKARLLLLSALTLGGSLAVRAQSAGNAVYSSRGSQQDYSAVRRAQLNANVLHEQDVVLEANVLSNLKATSYVAIFSVTQNGRTAAEADSLLNLRLQVAQTAMNELGIRPEALHVDIVSLVPTYAMVLEQKKFSRTANEVPTGFELKKNLHVIFTDHAVLDKLVTRLGRAEIYDLAKVDYNLADLQGAYEELRRAAAEVIKQKEGNYARMGLHVEVQNMTDGFQAVYPLERYTSYTAFRSGSTPEEVRLARQRKAAAANVYVSANNATVNVRPAARTREDDSEFIVRTADKAQTIYYNRTPYNSFDTVLHADFAEPRVQLIYTLNVRYSVLNQKQYEEYEAEKAKQKKGHKKDKD